MTVYVDTYTKAVIQTYISIDAASRVFYKKEELEVIRSGGVRKIVLPGTKMVITLQDLVNLGCKVLGPRTTPSLGLLGAEARWADRLEARTEAGLPSNVYIANARSIEYAIAHGRVPPPVKYIGRRRDKMTEVYDTVDEVVSAMNDGRWREKFAKGRYRSRT